MINGIDFHNMENMKYWSYPASWSMDRRKQEYQNRVYSGDWIGSWKHDGYFAKFIKNDDGTMELLGRTKGVNGDYANKIEWVPHLQAFFDVLPTGTCLLGELYLPEKEGSRHITSIMGCLKDKAISRQKEGGYLHFYIFDCLSFGGEIMYNKGAAERYAIITDTSEVVSGKYVEFAKYYTGADINSRLQEILGEGYEGMVLTHKDGKYEPGKRPSKTTLKCKKELSDTLDVFFTGRATAPTKEYTGKDIESWAYWYDERSGEKLEGELYFDYEKGRMITPVTKSFFNNFAGSLEIGVMKDGLVHPVGFLSGLTEEIKANYKDYKMRCIEVSAMEQDPDSGALRHGKMICFRDDLNPDDCTYEKFMRK